MKIQFASDLHIEFDYDIRRHGSLSFDYSKVPVAKTGSNVIVLAGDVFYQDVSLQYAEYLSTEHNKPVVLIFGNHDYWVTINRHRKGINACVNDLRAQAEALRHDGVEVYFLENDSIVINEVRFLGCTLWTDYFGGDAESMAMCKEKISDTKLISGPSDPAYFRGIHQESRAWLIEKLEEEFNGPTVIVTHHAPLPQSIKPVYQGIQAGGSSHVDALLNAAYFTNLESVMFDFKPELWIHGHTHHVVDYMIDLTRVVSNQRGYNDNGYLVDEYDPSKVIEV